ncbi:hypothetical protein CCP1ISM_60003 [Azospirillaceae bacterium]
MEEQKKKTDIEKAKLDERIALGIELVKKYAIQEKIPFDKDLFLEACKLGETMFVRSEIAYSGKR